MLVVEQQLQAVTMPSYFYVYSDELENTSVHLSADHNRDRHIGW